MSATARRRRSLLPVLATALAAAACTHGEAAPGAPGAGPAAPREVAVAVVRAVVQCGVEAPVPWVRWIGEPATWRRAFPPALLGAAPPPSEVDFARDAVLLVGMGQRPTAGHAVELASPAARLEGTTAVVKVALRAPAPGTMSAQVVTSPCLAVRLPRAGLEAVRVEDEAGTVLGTTRPP